ncbi:MAG: peptidoglycan-binding protein [Acidobacteria bacterium]|nr:peptidoglycan-binding protein [Acidobacteriota bacterium]
MALNYQVKQGDCISSIAFENGFFPDTIWDHPNNARLKEQRKDPNILQPGDIVFVPDKRIKELSEPTDQVHKYRYKSVPAKLSLRLLVNGEPRRNTPFTLEIDGNLTTGTTDSDGTVKVSIPPDAKSGNLTVGTGEDQMKFALDLGRLDPIDQISGVQKRLNNLGYDCGIVDGTLNSETKKALQAFQSHSGLPANGELDEATKSKLRQTHEGK